MDKDEIKGKAKDIAGRIERQAGEWTGSEEHQVKGTARQAEGKVQNIAGKAKDALRSRKDEEHEADRDIDREDRRRTG